MAAAAVLLLLTAAAAPVVEDREPFPTYRGAQLVALYDYAVAEVLPNLEPATGFSAVTGDEEVDTRIWRQARARGYVPRPVVASTELLATVDGVPMQPQAAAAWLELKAAARDAGLRFVVSSAYRSPASQRTQFLSKLEGSSDAAIDAALTWYSIPGGSKHHGGYALDFRYQDGTFAEFRNTPDYQWLAADNFHNPKRFGFIPSYPDDVTDQGPNPEPWEFVWVGVDLIRCGVPLGYDPALFGPHAEQAASIATCPGTVLAGRLGEIPPHLLDLTPGTGIRG